MGQSRETLLKLLPKWLILRGNLRLVTGGELAHLCTTTNEAATLSLV